MKHSSPKNEKIFSYVYEQALALDGDLTKMNTQQRTVYLVEHLMQEVNSGASFEQYFRWASIQEIKLIIPTLKNLNLNKAASIVDAAVVTAFPHGIPETEDEKEALTEWTEEQEFTLERLFTEIEELNGNITNSLGDFYYNSKS